MKVDKPERFWSFMTTIFITLTRIKIYNAFLNIFTMVVNLKNRKAK